MFVWDDLRFFLAVARTGTSIGAAAELGTSQPTVVRRICALEAASGVKLFDRSPSGYGLTEAGRAILVLAEEAAEGMQAVADGLDSLRGDTGSRIRLTLPDSMADFLLLFLQRFHQDWPGVQVQVLTSYRVLDLAKGEADMAIRVNNPPDSDALLVRPLPSAGWSVYASRDYAAQRALPQCPADLAEHPLIGGEELIAGWKAFIWLSEIVPNPQFVLRCNSVAGVQAAVRSGIGLSTLPCLLGEKDPALVRCFPPIAGLTSALWLVTRRELRRLPHVRALYDGICSHMQAEAEALTGPIRIGFADKKQRCPAASAAPLAHGDRPGRSGD